MTILGPDGKPADGSVCEHQNDMPTFDEDAAATMSATEIREMYPRFMGRCRDCGEQVILYASWKHYIGGDW